MIRCYQDDSGSLWIETSENVLRCISERYLGSIDSRDPYKGDQLTIGSEWPIDEVERTWGLTELVA